MTAVYPDDRLAFVSASFKHPSHTTAYNRESVVVLFAQKRKRKEAGLNHDIFGFEFLFAWC